MRAASRAGHIGETRSDWTSVRQPSDVDFEEFVQRHFDSLAKTLAVVTLDKELAADAAQEAFLQLYIRWHKIDKLDNPVAWLYRVGINRCRDYRRRLVRAARVFDRLTAAAGAEEPEEQWLPDVTFVALLRDLPKRQRVAAVLFYQADLSTAEIARVMHISEGAVKSHLHRARETLRPLAEAE